VAIHARTADYKSDGASTDLNGGRAPSRTRAPRPPEAGRADECLQLLARAVQQYHTYPPTSPLCHNAVEACQRALVSLGHRDQLDFRVTPHALIVEEVALGRGTLVEHELAHRLHAASIAQITIDRAASVRELSWFCLDLVNSSSRREKHANLIELLSGHGVNRITLRPAYRPEVLQVGAPPEPVASLVDQQRERRDELFAEGGIVDHLYPPDKGWVRLDPSSPLPNVSLIDLALMSDDPASLATMLLRLTDGDVSENLAPGDALSQKFSDVAMLFSALEPRIARVMFAKLARGVLDLDPDSRQTLLRRTILPGLLDGKIDGVVLRDFPDLDLADSLCLLLDLETAAPEVVTTALARLDLPAERHDAVLPLLKERLAGRNPEGGARETSVDAHAKKLVRMDRERAKSFAEFAAFDLALDQHALDALGQIREDIVASDVLSEQLACLSRLVRLEANPDVVQRFCERMMVHLQQLEQEQRWQIFADWLSRSRALRDELAEPRPDVANVISSSLEKLCTVERAARLVDLAAEGSPHRQAADAIVSALGAPIGGAIVTAIQARHRDSKDPMIRGAAQLLADHAATVAPALVAAIDSSDVNITRLVSRVLGLAGHGYEEPLAKQLASRDEQTVREALRSLARIGTPKAASHVRTAIEQKAGWLSAAAAETLWHFPTTEAHRQVRELLGRREFVVRQPQVAVRMLDREAQAGAAGLEPILATLSPLRYRLWSPALARVGRRAHALLNP
jgi:hypothetical protein